MMSADLLGIANKSVCFLMLAELKQTVFAFNQETKREARCVSQATVRVSGNSLRRFQNSAFKRALLDI